MPAAKRQEIAARSRGMGRREVVQLDEALELRASSQGATPSAGGGDGPRYLPGSDVRPVLIASPEDQTECPEPWATWAASSAGTSAVIEVRGGKQRRPPPSGMSRLHAASVVSFPLRTSHGRGV
jgi:hypothetical protein